MSEILWEYRYLITAGVCGVVYAAAEYTNTKNKVLQCIVAAKKLSKDKVIEGGEAQENWVVNRVYGILPPVAKIILTEDVLRKIIKNLYRCCLDLLDDGELNDSTDMKDKS